MTLAIVNLLHESNFLSKVGKTSSTLASSDTVEACFPIIVKGEGGRLWSGKVQEGLV